MSIVESIRKRLTFGLSAEQENRFRRTNFNADIIQARIFVLLIIIPFVALLVNDYDFFGFSRIFYGLLVLRLAFTIYTILFLKSLRGFQDYRSYDRAEFLWAFFLALANTAINATRPENFVAHTIVTVLTVFIVVLAIPNRFTNQLILALVYTIGQILVTLPSLQTSPQASFTVLLSMFMANAIAIASSWLLHFWSRRKFLVHDEIQEARMKAEMQLAERKKAEKALRESETLLSAFLERLPVGVGLFDPHGHLLISNSILSNLMGDDQQQYTQQPNLVGDSIPSHDPESSWRWQTWGADGHLIPQSEWPGAKALKGKNVTPGLDFLYASDNGQDIWMRVSSVPFRNNDGEITGVITVIQNIDKQKRADEALKKSEKSLAEAQRIAHLGNWDWNIVTNELHWSDETYRIFGLSPQEFRATYDAFLSYVHPDDRDYVNNAVKEALNGKTYSIDHRIISANGEEHIVHEQGEVIFDEKNTPVLMRGTVQDITERKKTELQLTAHLKALTRMHELSKKTLEEKDIQPMLQEIMDAAVEIMNAKMGTLQLIEDNSLRIVAHYGHQQSFLEYFESAEDVTSVCGETLQCGERVIVEDVETSSLFVGTPSLDIMHKAGVRSVQSTPMLSRTGKLVGILTTQWDVPYYPNEHDLWRIDLLARQAADLIEHARTEDALRKSEERFRALVTASSEVVYRMSPDWSEMNQLYGRGFLVDTENPSLNWTQEYILPEDQPHVTAVINEAIRTKGTFELEHRVLKADGSVGWTYSRAVPILDKNGEIVEWFGAASDITDRKQTEEELKRASEELEKRNQEIAKERQRLYDVLETLPVMICLLTPDYHVAFANRSFREKFGESDRRHCYEYCFGFNRPCEFCESYKVLETDQSHHWEVTTPEGSVIDVYDFPFTDVDGSPMILEMDIDITERRQAEEALAKIEIARKQEIHHRIKNNLQVISSLLDLAADKFSNRECIQNSEVLKAFKESQDRVISMALIHEELYKGEGFETLNFSLYIKELAENLFQTYKLTDTDISLDMYLEENVFFNMDIAVPLGIIINELISNSLKHAFKGKNKGEIRIKLHREENNECINSLDNSKEAFKSTGFVLAVSDNGVGISENLDIEDFESLGLQLVVSLVDQLDGELEMKRDNGTQFIIRFTVTEKNNQASEVAV